MLNKTIAIMIGSFISCSTALAESADSFHINQNKTDFISSTTSDFVGTSYFGSPKDFAKEVLDKAKGSIQSRAASLLVNALFGGGNSSGNLSQQSLEQIRTIVRDSIIESREYHALASLDALNSLLANYQSGASQNFYNYPLLSNIVQDASKLVNHEAFNRQYNQKYFYNIQNFMLISSLAASIYTEQYLQGQVSKEFVQSNANTLAYRLQVFKVDIISHVNANIYQNGCWPSGYFTDCEFIDRVTGNGRPEIASFYDGDYDYTPTDYLRQQRESVINTITGHIGAVDALIYELQNLTL